MKSASDERRYFSSSVSIRVHLPAMLRIALQAGPWFCSSSRSLRSSVMSPLSSLHLCASLARRSAPTSIVHTGDEGGCARQFLSSILYHLSSISYFHTGSSICLPAAIFVLLLLPLAAIAAPLAHCDRPVHNFGTLPNTNTVVHTFVIANNGDTPLQIKRIISSCSCAIAELDHDIIAPGKTADVEATLILDELVGDVRKLILLETNDPDTRFLQLAVECQATTELAADPSMIRFGNADPNAESRTNVQVICYSGQEIRIVDAGSDSQFFACDFDPAKTGTNVLVRVRTIPPVPEGRHAGWITLRTSHPNRPELKLRIIATAMNDISIVPKEIALPAGSRIPVTRSIAIRTRADQPFIVSEVIVAMPNATARIVRRSPGDYRVIIKNLIGADHVDGQTIRILTDLPEFEEIIIPIRAVRL